MYKTLEYSFSALVGRLHSERINLTCSQRSCFSPFFCIHRHHVKRSLRDSASLSPGFTLSKRTIIKQRHPLKNCTERALFKEYPYHILLFGIWSHVLRHYIEGRLRLRSSRRESILNEAITLHHPVQRNPVKDGTANRTKATEPLSRR